ncbi:MAG: DNA polymerase III subunit chi [bacterium]|nr:DNA polymerase III subunit chi [bacterium]
MDGKLVLHDLPGSKRVGELIKVLEELYHKRVPVVVWVDDEGRRQILDDYLWTYSRLGFLPHSVWAASMGVVDDPVVLVGEEGTPNGAKVLVVGDGFPPLNWAGSFETVHDFIPPGEEGEKRRDLWHQFGEDQ